MNNLVLITGGAKSGKSQFAESLALACELPVAYLATMPAIVGDSELVEKIKRHKERRPPTWRTIEVECDLDQALKQLPFGQSICLIDCLSLFVANLLNLAEPDDQKGSQTEAEERLLKRCRSALAEMEGRQDITFLTVTNEVGLGIVPDNPLARQFRDLLGAVNQEFAARASTVWLCCVGLPIKIKHAE